MIFLFVIWFFIVAVLTIQPEKETKAKQLTVPIQGQTKYYTLPRLPHTTRIGFTFEGGFLKEKFNDSTKNYLTLYLQSVKSKGNTSLYFDYQSSETIRNMTDPIYIPVDDPDRFDVVPTIKKSQIMFVKEDDLDNLKEQHGEIRLVMQSNFFRLMPIKIKYDYAPVNIDVGVIYAAFALIFLYGLIIWEVSYLKYFVRISMTFCSFFRLFIERLPQLWLPVYGEIKKINLNFF